MLSVWGSAKDDVYAVGGPLGNEGFEALVVHFDGAGWKRLPAGGAASYWWVHGSGPKDVWMVGEKGRITHFDGTTFVEHVSAVTATLWGVYAASPTEAWAVGGTPNGGVGAPNDIVLRWDGGSWSPITLPGAPLGRTLYKIWGSGADDLYAVGEKGTIWHATLGAWSLVDPAPVPGKLLTVAGCSATEVYAVGGSSVLRSDGASFSKVGVSLTNLVNGVACGPSESVLLVGDGGQKQRLVSGRGSTSSKSSPSTTSTGRGRRAGAHSGPWGAIFMARRRPARRAKGSWRVMDRGRCRASYNEQTTRDPKWKLPKWSDFASRTKRSASVSRPWKPRWLGEKKIDGERTRLLAELPLIVDIFDLASKRSVFKNQELDALLGHPPGALAAMGPQPMVYKTVHPDDLSRVLSFLERMLDENAVVDGINVEYRVIRGDGAPGWFRSQLREFDRTDDQRLSTLLMVTYDITEAKVAEAALRALNEELDGLVAARTASLEDANVMLREEITLRARVAEEADRRARLIRELGSPVLRIWDDVLAVPIIGALDTERAEIVTEALLGRSPGPGCVFRSWI